MFLKVRLQFPFILSGRFEDKYAKLAAWRMKEYYGVDGSMSELFLEGESDIVSGSNNPGRNRKIYLPQVEIIKCKGPGCTLPPVITHHTGL